MLAAHCDPQINLVDRTNLSGEPPATLITAQIDPRRSENIADGEALKAEGARNVDARVLQAVDAVDIATARLKAAFADQSRYDANGR